MGRKALLVAKSKDLERPLSRVLGPDWDLDASLTSENFLNSLSSEPPELLLVENELDGLDGLSLLRLAHERQGLLPPSILLASGPLNETGQARAISLGVLEVVAAPFSEPKLERCLAPFLRVTGSCSLSLPEFLAMAHRHKSRGFYQLVSPVRTLLLEVENGLITGFVDPVFRDRWRSALEAVGLTLPPPLPDPVEDLKSLEGLLPDSPELMKLKRQTVLTVFASIPVKETFSARHIRMEGQTPSLPLNIPSILSDLSEHIPEAALAPLRSEELTVRSFPARATLDLALSPRHGYLLASFGGATPVLPLLRSGVMSETDFLRSLYYLLLTGLMEPVPPAGEPFSLDLLAAKLAEQARRRTLQMEAIKTLSRSLLAVGASPYQVLGVPPTATFSVVRQTFESLMGQLDPAVLHPRVAKELESDILWINAKISEAFLLIQASFLQEKKAISDVDVDLEKDIHRLGVDKTKAQQISDSRQREAERLFATAKSLLEDDENSYQASQFLKLALFYNPRFAACHHMLGRIYQRSAHPSARYMAERAFLEAIDIDPWEINHHLDLAQLYADQNFPARSKVYLEKAQGLNARDPRIAAIRKALKEK